MNSSLSPFLKFFLLARLQYLDEKCAVFHDLNGLFPLHDLMTRLVDWSWLGFRSWHSVFLNERRRGTPVDRPAICGVVAYSSEDACDTQISLIVPICFLLLESFMGAIHGIVSPSALLDIHFLGRTLFAFSSLQLR